MEVEQTRLLSTSATKMDEYDMRMAYQAMEMNDVKLDNTTMDIDKMVIETPRVTIRSVDEDHSEFDIE
jgi:hypothetical protein